MSNELGDDARVTEVFYLDKAAYEELELEVIVFDAEDVIVTSDINEGEGS